MGAAKVLGPDAGGKTVLRVIGQGDGFVFVAEWCDMQYRAEDLLLHEGRVLWRRDGDRRLDEGPVVAFISEGRNSAACNKFAAMCRYGIQQRHDLVTVPVTDQRADVEPIVAPFADDDLVCDPRHHLHEFVKARAVNICAFGAEADLAAIEEGRPGHALGHGIHARVIEDKGCVLAAKLQRDFSQAVRCRLHDGRARTAFARKGDCIHFRMRCKELARRAGPETVNEAECAVGYIRGGDHFGQDCRGRRCLFRWLQDGRVAHHQCRRDLHARHEKRYVPGADAGDDPLGASRRIPHA